MGWWPGQHSNEIVARLVFIIRHILLWVAMTSTINAKQVGRMEFVILALKNLDVTTGIVRERTKKEMTGKKRGREGNVKASCRRGRRKIR